MKTRKHLLPRFVLSLFASILILALTQSAQVQQGSANVATTSKPGLHVTTFDTLSGRVTVNLPDDIAAGDTISGTVMVEPNGRTQAEVQEDQSELNGMVIEWSIADGDKKSPNPVQVLGKLDISTFGVYPFHLEFPGGGSKEKPVNSQLKTKLTGKDGTQLFDDLFIWGSFEFSKPNLQLPVIGQQGRPVEIQGPFDGSFENTRLTLGGEEVALLAESPRKAIFRSPIDTTGPVEIVVREGKTETKGEYRNVKVKLSAPKTNLIKGESTTLKIEISGLEGIKEPVPLHLVKGGVVTMQGGDVQTISIKPAEVLGNGTFSTTRTITGEESGAWNATVTVVIFDVCLQDDNNGNLLIFSSGTGDYVFCQNSHLGSENPKTIGTPSSDFRGGVMVQAGDSLDITRTGALASADYDYAGGHMHWEVDNYTHTGSATVQTTKPKQTFTITDRDTRNNTCTCK